MTADGSTAVVANLDSTFATVVDLDALTGTSVGISTRASQVEISPDGTRAYLAVVASGDGVWRIDLQTLLPDGPKLPTGNMGSIFFNFQQSSGMTLSHDGLTLVTCNSFDDSISIIDTVAWTEHVRLPVGDFPVRAVFSADDSRIFVTNRDADTVAIVSNLGPASSVTSTIPVGDQPFTLAVAPTGARLYVSNFADSTISAISLVAAPGPSIIPLTEPAQDLFLDAAGERLYAAGGSWSVTLGPGPAVTINQSGAFTVIDAPAASVIETVDTGQPPGNLAFHEPTLRAVLPAPLGDGVTVLTGPSCPGDVDGSGAVDTVDFLALLAAWGPNPGHPANLNGDDVVDTIDFLALLANWGPCP